MILPEVAIGVWPVNLPLGHLTFLAPCSKEFNRPTLFTLLQLILFPLKYNLVSKLRLSKQDGLYSQFIVIGFIGAVLFSGRLFYSQIHKANTVVNMI